MEFTLTPLLLMPTAIGIFAVYVLKNHEKFTERNRRFEEGSRITKALRPTHYDPEGRLTTVAGVGMLVIAMFQFLAIGTGWIET